MIFVGIDPGIRPTICMKNQRDQFRFITLPTNPPNDDKDWQDTFSRLIDLRHRLENFFEQNLLDRDFVVGVESVAFGKPYRASLMGKIELVIQDALFRYVTFNKVAMIAPTTMKKMIAGDGHAEKHEVRDAILLMYPQIHHSRSDNEIDAAGICLVVERYYEVSTLKPENV